MNRLINKLSEYLAAPKSRRGFIRTISRVTVGVSAVAAGIALGTGVASASPDLTCCTSTDPVQHQNEHLCSPQTTASPVLMAPSNTVRGPVAQPTIV